LRFTEDETGDEITEIMLDDATRRERHLNYVRADSLHLLEPQLGDLVEPQQVAVSTKFWSLMTFIVLIVSVPHA
jgi:hypothetical protein